MKIINFSLMVILTVLIGFSCSQQKNEQEEADTSVQIAEGPHW